MRAPVLWIALGASVLLHWGVLVGPGSVISRFFSQAKDPDSSKIPSETQLIPVEIKRFYVPPLETPQESPGVSLEKERSAPGSAWMKKMDLSPVFKDEVTYSSYIRDLIVRHLVYPPEMQSQGYEVAVRVVFKLNKQGQLLQCHVAQDLRSRYMVFNEAAVRAVRHASPFFPPFPQTVSKEDQQFSFLLLFRPDKN